MEAWRKELYHYGIKGMKWGVRRTPEQLGHRTRSGSLASARKDRIDKLRKTYRSKMQTGATHYRKAIRDVNKVRSDSSKRERKYNKWSGEHQYSTAASYDKQARKLQKKLKRMGIEVNESASYSELKREASEHYVKKFLARRVFEHSVTAISETVQVQGQLLVRSLMPAPVQALLFRGPMIVNSTEVTDYKMKRSSMKG